MIQDTTFLSFDGTELCVRKDVPSVCGGVVLLLHGLGEHIGRYDYVAVRLNEAGLGVYRFDFRGHGRSAGERGHFSDLEEVLGDVNAAADLAAAENPGKPLFLVGHGLGGLWSLLYCIRYPGKVKGTVLSGALSQDKNGIFTGIPEGADVHTRVPNELIDAACSLPFVAQAHKKDSLAADFYTYGLCRTVKEGLCQLEEKCGEFQTPVLLLHGQCDRVADAEESCALFRSIPVRDRQIKLYGGLHHELFSEPCKNEIISDAVFWILRRIG